MSCRSSTRTGGRSVHRGVTSRAHRSTPATARSVMRSGSSRSWPGSAMTFRRTWFRSSASFASGWPPLPGLCMRPRDLDPRRSPSRQHDLRPTQGPSTGDRPRLANRLGGRPCIKTELLPQRRAAETALLERYLAQLGAHGVQDYSIEQLRTDCGRALLLLLAGSIGWVTTVTGDDLTARERALQEKAVSGGRLTAALLDYGALDLIG